MRENEQRSHSSVAQTADRADAQSAALALPSVLSGLNPQFRLLRTPRPTPWPADRDAEHIHQRLRVRIEHRLCQCNGDGHRQPDGHAVSVADAQPHPDPIAGEGSVHTLRAILSLRRMGSQCCGMLSRLLARKGRPVEPRRCLRFGGSAEFMVNYDAHTSVSVRRRRQIRCLPASRSLLPRARCV
jgi:hypothetical protein